MAVAGKTLSHTGGRSQRKTFRKTEGIKHTQQTDKKVSWLVVEKALTDPLFLGLTQPLSPSLFVDDKHGRCHRYGEKEAVQH